MRLTPEQIIKWLNDRAGMCGLHKEEAARRGALQAAAKWNVRELALADAADGLARVMEVEKAETKP